MGVERRGRFGRGRGLARWHRAWRGQRRSRDTVCELLQSEQTPGRAGNGDVERGEVLADFGDPCGDAVLEDEPDADLVGVDHRSIPLIAFTITSLTERALPSASLAAAGARYGRGEMVRVPSS